MNLFEKYSKRREPRVRLEDHPTKKIEFVTEDTVAQAIYNANRNNDIAPSWSEVSDDVRRWVRRQARAALAELGMRL